MRRSSAYPWQIERDGITSATSFFFVSLLFFGLGQKNGNFPIFLLLGKIFYEKVFHDSLERKSAFLGYKNPDKKEFQKVEKLAFIQRG